MLPSRGNGVTGEFHARARALSLISTSISSLQALLTELARARQHGVTEQEIAAARLQQMSEAESMYRERNQTYSTVDFLVLLLAQINGKRVQ